MIMMMKNIYKRLQKILTNNPLLFSFVKKHILKYFNVLDLRKSSWLSQDPFVNESPYSSYESKYPFILGIIKEFWHMHKHYIAACKDLHVAYKLLDISGPNWQDIIRDSDCDAFLVRPSVQLGIWKQMYDERLRIIAYDMGKIIFPSYEECWLWESKRRMCYWLEERDIPHAKTWIFYDRTEAINFVESCKLPIVFKSDMGSGASGVIIFRDRKKLKRHINLVFRKGFTTYRRSPNDKEWGFVILQEYLGDVREWRIIRIGDSYFGYEKMKADDFHSGSHIWSYSQPPLMLLDVIRDISERNNFLNMDFDIFLTPGGKYFINELQTLFGLTNPYACKVNDVPGRMLYNANTREWEFQAGDFCRNNLCNLRVQTLLGFLRKETVIKTNN